MSEQLQNQNKKPFYKRTWFFVVVGLVVVGLISTAFAGEEDVTSNPTATESQESVAQVVALVVPDLVGENASDASEELEILGFTEITLQDVSEDERFVVLPTNWFVCEMKPEPTNTLDSDKTLVLLVVKNTESCDSSGSGESATDASPSEESEFEEKSFRLSVMNLDDDQYPDFEVWIRGSGAWFPDLAFGGDVFDSAGPFPSQAILEGDFFIYPFGRDGIEVPVALYLSSEHISDSVRDMLSIVIEDRVLKVYGPVEDRLEVDLDLG